ncbi:unnamed protein product [Amaranthus hypochondriacus]
MASRRGSQPGVRKVTASDDQHFDDTVPNEDDALINNDVFETQVMDFDFETQPIELDNETQILELAGETQLMDECNLFEHMDTQVLDVLDNEDWECTSDRRKDEDEETQLIEDLDNAELQDTGGTQITPLGENRNFCFRHGDVDGVKEESLPLDTVAPCSGSLKRGFPSVRTASLRKAGLAALEKASKNNESSSTNFSSLSSELHPSENHQEISNVKKVSLEIDLSDYNDKSLLDGKKSNVARPLARYLYVEEDDAETESDDGVRNRREDFSHIPCDNDIVGLSYVDSQEPGELSQANALEFVDKFLKGNLFESDQGEKCRSAAGELGNPGSIAKAAKSASLRSKLAKPSLFEWDDNLEDEGGGEFFTKTKEVLLGHKSCPKPQSSRHHEPSGSQSLGKLRSEKELRNLHETTRGCPDSDLKLVKGGSKGKVQKMDIVKKISSGQQLAALPTIQSVDMQNVGIETQMAAEAMEELSAGIALLKNNSGVSDQGCQSNTGQNQKEAIKSGPSKQGSRKKRTYIFTSGVVTRSRIKDMLMKTRQQSKCYFTPETRGQSVIEKFNAGPVKPKKKQNKLSLNNTLAESKTESSNTGRVIVGDKRRQSALEGQLTNDSPQPSKRQSLRGKVKPAVQEAVQRMNNADDSACNPRETHLGGGVDIGIEFTTRRTRSKRRSSLQCAQCPKDREDLLSGAMSSFEDTHRLPCKKKDACSPPAKGTLGSPTVDGTPENLQKPSTREEITPVGFKTPSAVSPICMGDGYHTPSCKKKILLKHEVTGLIASDDRYSSPFKGLRQRRDMNNVCVLFSQHLDDDIVRHQKKVLTRLGVAVASTISEATHFVADSFTRTRNMLEAIANAKPVVTPLWLQSCGQANCFIDEKNYILRDAKKEKELNFSMPKSLAHASLYPLLEGKRVLITPNVKPGKEVISGLVKAVHGLAIERLGRSMSSDEKLIDNLLVLSCEEDFSVCVPLLEKGIAIYNSELLLNGIITQRLEYERYRLFVSQVKKTRSTLWLKKGAEQFIPVTKTK